MHKKELIKDVAVKILPDNMGLEVLLYDDSGIIIHQELLSMGEQQIYVSCLLKAILKESISDLPVIIDTPLGRLDIEHKENILKNYYPSLANQVIIFSTNDEITTKRLNTIKDIVNCTYLLKNQDNKTSFIKGYFNDNVNKN